MLESVYERDLFCICRLTELLNLLTGWLSFTNYYYIPVISIAISLDIYFPI
jgi:hypothetical protein